MIEHIARAVYYCGVHLLYTSLVWLAALGLTTAIGASATALAQFEATLKKEPGRFRALYGAGRAAQLAGQPNLSRTYFRELLRTCEHRDRPGREDFLQAEKAVIQNQNVTQ
jgi:hypothetical protein